MVGDHVSRQRVVATFATNLSEAVAAELSSAAYGGGVPAQLWGRS
jgi:hypothetical protein